MKKTFLLLVFLGFSLNAQVTKSYNKTPLSQVLNEIATSYGVIFSFSNDVIKDKKITTSFSNTSLDEILISLRTLTNLAFNKISDRQITISSPDTKTSICGYIFDADTNGPLSYASVLIKDKNEGVITDENGYFILEKIAINTAIVIQHVGYTEKTITVASFKKTNCQRIRLLKESTTLEEVLIIEYITKGVGKNINGSIRITNEELGILPGQVEPDIFQSLQGIPGINSPDETATGIQIRGGSPDQNLILWDGIKMYNTGHFFGLISAFNPYIISETKVFKGGADPKYGDRVSGVIDISSDTKIPEKINGGFGINGTHADLFLKTPIAKKVGLIVSGRRAYTDFLETPTYASYFDKVFQNTKIAETSNQVIPDEDEIEDTIIDDNFFFYDTSIKLIADITNGDKVMMSGIYTKNDLAFEINNDEDQFSDDLTIQNEGLSFSWEGTKFGNIHHSLKGYYAAYESRYQFTISEELEIEEQSIRENKVKDVGVDLSIRYDLNQKNAIALGYQFSNNEVFYNITRDSDFENPISESDLVKNSANSVYANYSYSPKNRGSINLGIRASHYAIVDELYVAPRIHMEYPITKSLRIKATGEQRYQPISQLVEFEDTQLRVENSLWIHSDNEEVPILESTQFSSGLLFTKKGWNVEIDGYYKNIEGLTSLTNGFNNINTDLSIGESKIIGADVLIKKRFHNFRTWVGYTFNNINYTFPEIQEASFPGNNDITHNFRISNTLELAHWEFSLGWFWRSGAPFTDADLVNDEIDFTTPNAQRLPNYHRMDLSLTYNFNFSKNSVWKGQLGASILNIYNRQVPLSVSYRLDEDTDNDQIELEILRQQSLGITPNLTFRMWF